MIPDAAPDAVPLDPAAAARVDRAATDVLIARSQRLAKLRTGKPDEVRTRWATLKVYYRDHPADFINDWGVTIDPRMAEIGLPVVLPFVLWPKQRQYIEWLYARWTNREDGLCEKSRDAGVSWLCVGFAVWMWGHHPGAVVGFGSRKEEYVDDSSDPKSLFWKARSFIDYLPVELRPAGYDRKRHAPYMKIENPELGGMIVGEAGDNIGRGNRTSIYFKDESAFFANPEAVDAALSQTSNCKIDVSTPNGPAGPFYRKRHGGKIPVFTFHWRDDPRKGEAWYAKQKATLDAVILAQEVDIDYNASTTNSYISGQLITDAQARGPADVEALGAWIVGVDAAHFGDDKSVIQGRRGRLTMPSRRRAKVDGPTLAGNVIAYCVALEATGARVAAIVIELDGPGVSCFDHLRLNATWGPRVVGIHTGARTDNDKHYNLKALLWDNAKAYLMAPPVSLPKVDEDGKDVDIKSDIGNYRYTYRDGVLLMESKKEYKKRAGKSPDDGDAWILTHIPGALIPKPLDPSQNVIPSTVSRYPATTSARISR
jgi:phage terminase large subunit